MTSTGLFTTVTMWTRCLSKTCDSLAISLPVGDGPRAIIDEAGMFSSSFSFSGVGTDRRDSHLLEDHSGRSKI